MVHKTRHLAHNDGNEPRVFLRSIHYFRGLAILSVATVHLWAIPPSFGTPLEHRLTELIRQVAFHGSTMYFLFLAGFLFMHLADTFEWKSFFRKKFLHLLLPYCVVTTFWLALKKLIKGDLSPHWIEDWGVALVTGNALTPLWFVPLIALLYLLSPALLLLGRRQLAWLTGIACLFPLLGCRTGTELSLGQFLYFAPVYLLGYWVRKEDELCRRQVSRHLTVLVIITTLSSLGLFWVQAQPLRYGWIDLTESLFYLQKISLTLVVWRALQAWELKHIAWLDLVATHSFPIFFLHCILGNFHFSVLFFSLVSPTIPGASSLLAGVFVALVVGLSLFASISLRALLGKRSRYIVGA
jgi:hypothetical protein